jgi:branched-chain amino acid transport system substrate-binding protein
LAVQSPYGDGLVDAMDTQLGKRAVTRTVQSDGKGIDTAVQSLASEGLQALVIIGNAAVAIEVANQRAKHAGLKDLPMWFADGACDGELLKQTLTAGVSLAGVQCTRPGQPPTPVYEKFRERYQQQFSSDPAAYSYTQHAFDATYCVALAHAWALGSKGSGKANGASLAEGLRHLSSGPALSFKPSDITAMIAALSQGTAIDASGASSPLDFNSDTGEAPSDYELWTLGAAGELKTGSFLAIRDDGGGKYTVLPADATGT